MPLFLTALLGWARRRPLFVLLMSGVLGAVVYTQWSPLQAVPTPRVLKAQLLPGVGAERATMEGTLLDVQKENAGLRSVQHDHERAMQSIQAALATAEQQRQAAAEAQEARFQEMLKRPQPVARPTPPTRAAPRQQVTAPPRTLPPQVALPLPAQQSTAEIRILRHGKPASYAGTPSPANRGDTPYLPAGSYAVGRLVTGVFATSRSGGALPVLFAVTQSFHGPFQVRGPGRSPIATALPIEGCLILGKAQADLGSSRVLVKLETLSCVFPDGDTFERPLKGYATGIDGTLGLIGQLETRDSAYLARTFLTALMAGAGEAFAIAKRTTVVTPFGGSITTQTGNIGETAGYAALANASAQLSAFYLQQAERLMPVLWAPSGVSARLVLEEGLPLEGLPTFTMTTERE